MIEAERLEFLQNNQTILCAKDYTSVFKQLEDPGSTENNDDVVRAGRMSVLPSTYVGGDRYMRQKLHSIISISNKLEYSDSFLTITCSLQWPETRNALLHAQSAFGRPDL